MGQIFPNPLWADSRGYHEAILPHLDCLYCMHQNKCPATEFNPVCLAFESDLLRSFPWDEQGRTNCSREYAILEVARDAVAEEIQ